VRLVPVPGGHRVIPDFNGETFNDVTTVWHEVTRAGQTIRLTPLA